MLVAEHWRRRGGQQDPHYPRRRSCGVRHGGVPADHFRARAERAADDPGSEQPGALGAGVHLDGASDAMADAAGDSGGARRAVATRTLSLAQPYHARTLARGGVDVDLAWAVARSDWPRAG